MKNVLVVEDEISLLEMLKLNLELEGYAVEIAQNGNEAMALLPKINKFDLVILDVMMPHVNGLDVCLAIRKISQVPVLFLSAKGTSADRVAGLKIGGNDYLPKPFDLEELLLRVSVLTGSGFSEPEKEKAEIGSKMVDFKSFQVLEDGREIALLTKREIQLIQLFFKHQGEVVARDKILDLVWGVDQYPTTRTIDNYILNFRKIFELDPKSPKYFHSVRGVGYRFTPNQ
jgi:two-component system alkaline phosphatase synthesis response regulator PhoP